MNASSAQPPVLKWYRIYSGLMALLYVIVLVGVVLVAVFGLHEIAKSEMEVRFLLAYIVLVLGLSALLAGGFIASFFLPVKPWAWTYHLVLICIGLTSPCCLPVSIPLLIFWFKEETQQFFGREST